ncbi:Peroxisome biosynthesis protein pex1 [Trapelia coarctata]|nr:Peroxisome biosynthesis protein pex1 [Trapelia coarctata]
MSPKRAATPAELALVALRNCLVNLPPPLVAALGNSNTTVQNVVVEIQYRSVAASAKGTNPQLVHQSIYVGWTGMASQRRLLSTVVRGTARTAPKEPDPGVVELDAAFGRMIGFADGQKTNILLHVDPPLAHTVNIEPLTPADWEIIELHATFLEVNLVAQIRALPNPSFTGAPSTPARQPHALTLHLSPTSTANIIITSLSPPLPSSIPFAKLAPDAEVIVTPKARSRTHGDQQTESRSNASVGQRSTGGRSTLGSTRRRSSHREEPRRVAFLRGLSRGLCSEAFDDAGLNGSDDGLKIWVNQGVLASKGLMGLEWACVSVVEPSGLQTPMDAQQHQRIRDQESSTAGKHASKIVAKLQPWSDALDTHHAVISTALGAALGVESIVGSIIRLEIAPNAMPKGTVRNLKIFPFIQVSLRQKEGLKFGGETRRTRESATEQIRAMYGPNAGAKSGMFGGPLTDGLVLPTLDVAKCSETWNGGLLRFDSPSSSPDSENSNPRWLLGGPDTTLNIEIQNEIANPYELRKPAATDIKSLPSLVPSLAGVEDLISRATSHLIHRSSMLLTGGLGSGKTSVAQQVGHLLRRKHFYHVSYLSCRKLVADETRVSSLKDTFSRTFMTASWATRMGGFSMVILDDLDAICPAETELQVGGENGRNRQLSELIRSTVRQYCFTGSGTVLLMTAQNREALNSVIIGGHIVREIIDLKAPAKALRRQVLGLLVDQNQRTTGMTNGVNGHLYTDSGDGWMDGSLPNSRPNSVGGTMVFRLGPDLDLLAISGQTDGYMPGDLVLLVSRARSEALIRAGKTRPQEALSSTLELCNEDFQAALKGFTPATLRNVTLQSSSTTFDSIGGLHATRKTLLETLQYPTTYAPIFAQCPLRLRSGLLLYGFPGCGKTLLASAVAGECGLNFISIKGPEILNKYIGASEKSVRDLFERAQAAKPCVLFFDEFDSIAPKRGHDSTGVTDRVVNQLLTQMDGAEGLSGVYVLAATSRPDLIDPALLRPGRLDKSLICDLPDVDERLDILRALIRRLNIDSRVLADDVSHRNLAAVARQTEGYSGADLQALVYNAQLEAIHSVLGDHNGTVHQANGAAMSPMVTVDPATRKEFIQFRFGEDEDRQEAAERAAFGVNRSKQATEHAALIAKLDATRKAKKREMTQQDSGSATTEQGAGGSKATNSHVVIEWQHIEASLRTTRSSISSEERHKLGAIYKEFQVGRNGEMPSGQGGVEIGARSSLM